jgi:hypothetical protein
MPNASSTVQEYGNKVTLEVFEIFINPEEGKISITSDAGTKLLISGCRPDRSTLPKVLAP